MSRPLSVRIDRLVLHGVRPADRHVVADALAAELSRLLAERGAPPGLGRRRAFARMASRPAHLPTSWSPRRLGEQAAAAIYETLEQRW